MIQIFNTYILLLIIKVFQPKQHYFNTQNVMIYCSLRILFLVIHIIFPLSGIYCISLIVLMCRTQYHIVL